MNWQSIAFDWNRARAFLVTAEEGSLSAAAKALGLTQPTLSRQVAALEEELGVTLFERLGRSLELTGSGLDLLDHMRAMGDAASRISLAASGQSQAVEGTVTVTASDAMAAYMLPDILKRVRDQAPGITVEVLASNDLHDLRRREADIAIRHIRPDYPDLIGRRVRDMSARLYASADWLEKNGTPRDVAEVNRAQFIGYAPPERLIEGLNGLGFALTRNNFRLISNSGVVGWEMVRTGLGLGVMVSEIADLTPEVETVLPDLDPFPVEVWLVTHRELHTARRIRLIFDLLVEAFA